MNYECIKTYSAGDWEPPDPGAELTAKTRQYCADHNVSFEEGFERVIQNPANSRLVHQYTTSSYGPDQQLVNIPELVQAPRNNDAGDRLHAAVEQVMKEFGEKDYQTAMSIALELHPELRRAYAGV